MLSNLWNKFKSLTIVHYFLGIIIGSLGLAVFAALFENPALTEYKGGVQNHLVWTIKGECYFVRPATNTVYLVRVEDCDKGNK